MPASSAAASKTTLASAPAELHVLARAHLAGQVADAAAKEARAEVEAEDAAASATGSKKVAP